MGIGDKIKQRRLELGMSQQELAEAMGYTSKSTINKIELGKNDITQSKVVKFAKILHTTPAFLMNWENESVNWENRPEALTENLEENVKYILEHEDHKLIETYKQLIMDDKLVLLVDKAAKLSPESIVQLLKIADTFAGDRQELIDDEIKDNEE